MKNHNITALLLVIAALIIVPGSLFSQEKASPQFPELKEFRVERNVSDQARECIKCHAEESSGIVADWARSRHAHANVTCLDCHGSKPGDLDISKDHYEYDPTAISPIVSPKDCSRCHPDEAEEYSRSKHANTMELIWKIDPWLNDGLNNEIERATGCMHCHGSVVTINPDGDFEDTTWPNVGVGRINPDGTKGSCSGCHTRHEFTRRRSTQTRSLWSLPPRPGPSPN